MLILNKCNKYSASLVFDNVSLNSIMVVTTNDEMVALISHGRCLLIRDSLLIIDMIINRKGRHCNIIIIGNRILKKGVKNR